MRGFAILTVALLGACSDPGPGPKIDTPPAAPMVLAGVDLGQPVRALGTEPFWGLEITPSALTLTGVDRPALTAPNPGATLQGTTAVYRVQPTNGPPLEVTLIATECSDGMSDRSYPLTARIVLGNETLGGCASPAAALNVAAAS